jgi:hypothetical protein
MAGPSNRVRNRLAVPAVILALVVSAAGLGGWWLEQEHRHPGGPESPPVVTDGPTFDQVLSKVVQQVNATSGGPWALFSIYGIAASVGFSPNLIGYASGENVTVNYCSRELDGLTLWNGTIPTFNGTFNSGTAPFWQLGYYSSAANEILVVTDVLGKSTVYPPLALPNVCHPWYDFFVGSMANWTALGSNLPVDSSRAAAVVWGTPANGTETVADFVGQGGPYTEIMTSGPGMFEGFGDQPDSGWGFIFDKCGEAGVTGVQPFVAAGVNRTGGGPIAFVIEHNCALQYSGAPAGYDSEYDLIFSSATVTSTPAQTVVETSFQVAIAYPNGTLAGDFDEVGLANWMTAIQLNDSSGQTLALATSTCTAWITNVSKCGVSSSGWFAVLLSPWGSWIDSYGLSSNGTPRWAMPVEAVVSNQILAIVAPQSWNVTADTLSVNSTVSFSVLIGSRVL